MADTPEISVVMGVYNNRATIEAAVASILTQAGVNLEFIVVDDGSTDGSAEILDESARRDVRLRVVHQTNEGLTRALIAGCAQAVAPWIARQDADDISLPGRLRAQLNRARQSDDPVLVGCGARTLAPEGEILMEYHPPVSTLEATRRVRVDGQAISPHGSIMFRRDAYEKAGGYREEYYYAQDIDLTTRLAEIGPVAAVPEILFEYQLAPDAISGRHGRYQRAFYRLIRRGHEFRMKGKSEDALLDAARRLSQKCLRRRNRGASAYELYYFIGTRLLAVQPVRAGIYFRKALALRPWSFKAFIRWRQALGRSRAGGSA